MVWYRSSSSADARRHLGPLPLPRVHCKGPGLWAPCHRHVHTSTVTTLSVLLLPAVLGPLHVLPTHAQIAVRRPRPTGKPSSAHGLVIRGDGPVSAILLRARWASVSARARVHGRVANSTGGGHLPACPPHVPPWRAVSALGTCSQLAAARDQRFP